MCYNISWMGKKKNLSKTQPLTTVRATHQKG
jgi:hypothetical protein